ncbi:hypothetical protein BJ508DRAFT_413030 [Ascobolus immersus RN42]|uniref:Uncharacterized protein n=1 Tax=Ascobolus immersus RN42 TaxID=1160509 RepID=A0A3N4IDY7_ASCIM|nr:hypothetical protein BJ508DRAFT_413030 [Ascobolus immersus RN42]
MNTSGLKLKTKVKRLLRIKEKPQPQATGSHLPAGNTPGKSSQPASTKPGGVEHIEFRPPQSTCSTKADVAHADTAPVKADVASDNSMTPNSGISVSLAPTIPEETHNSALDTIQNVPVQASSSTVTITGNQDSDITVVGVETEGASNGEPMLQQPQLPPTVTDLSDPSEIADLVQPASSVPLGADENTTLSGPSGSDCQLVSGDKINASTSDEELAAEKEKIWNRAYELAQLKLSKEEQSQLPGNLALGQEDSFFKIIEESKQLQAQANGNENGTGENNDKTRRDIRVMERVDKMIKVCNEYAKVVDIAVGHQPEVFALVWGGLRFMMQVYLNHQETLEAINDMMEKVGMSLARAELYYGIYYKELQARKVHNPSVNTEWEREVSDALPEFYASILVVTIKARMHLAPASAIRRTLRKLKPFLLELRGHITEMMDRQHKMKELAEAATMKRTQGIEANTDLLPEMHSTIASIPKIEYKLQHIETTINSMKEVMESGITDVKAKEWLHAVNSSQLYEKNAKLRLDGTCTWIFEDERFKAWESGSHHGSLWIVGIPGAGKTVLASAVIEHLEESSDDLLVYFYFLYSDTSRKQPVDMMASIIAQLLKAVDVHESSDLMRILKSEAQDSSIFAKSHALEDDRDYGKLCKLFIQMVSSLQRRVFVVLDALDECEAPEEVATFVKMAASLMETPRRQPVDSAAQSGISGPMASIQILLTGRPTVDSFFSSLPSITSIGMEVDADIMKLVEDKVGRHDALRPHKDLIIAKLRSNSKGMFRYAALVLEELEQVLPVSLPIEKRLSLLPRDVFGMYESILLRLSSKSSDGELEMRKRIFIWLSLTSLDPIIAPTVRMLQLMCTIVPGDIEFDPSTAVLPTREQLLASCGSLIEVVPLEECRCEALLKVQPEEREKLVKKSTSTRPAPHAPRPPLPETQTDSQDEKECFCGARYAKEMGGYVRFTHKTVEEFLCRDRQSLSASVVNNPSVYSCLIKMEEAHLFTARCYFTQIMSATSSESSGGKTLSQIYMTSEFRPAMRQAAWHLQAAAVASRSGYRSETQDKLWSLISRFIWDIKFAEHFESWYHSPALDFYGPCFTQTYSDLFKHWSLSKTKFRPFMRDSWRCAPIRPEFLLVELNLADVVERHYPDGYAFGEWTMNWGIKKRVRYDWNRWTERFTRERTYDSGFERSLYYQTFLQEEPWLHSADYSWPTLLELAIYFGQRQLSLALIRNHRLSPSKGDNGNLWAALVGSQSSLLDILLDYEHPNINTPNEFGETLLASLPASLDIYIRETMPRNPSTVQLFLVNDGIVQELIDPESMLDPVFDYQKELYRKFRAKGAKSYGELGYRLVTPDEVEVSVDETDCTLVTMRSSNTRLIPFANGLAPASNEHYTTNTYQPNPSVVEC